MLEHFPDPYPDEVLYSVWARYADQVTHPTLRDIHRELFGRSSVNSVIDLPCHLEYFVNNLPLDHSYSADYFIDNHTLLSFYSTFLPFDKISHARQQMLKGSAEAIHSRFRILGRNIPRPSWLRYCPLCVKQDRVTYGEAYWHRLHHVPGVEVCPLHATFLENSTVHSRREFTNGDFISAERVIGDLEPRNAESFPFYEMHRAVASAALYLLEHPRSYVNFDFFHQQYRAILACQGFLSRSGLICRTNLMQAFMKYYPQEFLTLLHCEPNSCKYVGDFLVGKTVTAKKEGTAHPIHHILLIRFLGCNIETFLTHHIEMPAPFGNGPWPCLNPVCELYQQECITSYKLGTHTTARRPVGVFSCVCSFTYARSGPDQSTHDKFRRERIISFGPTWEKKLREFWLSSTNSVASIGRALKVSPNVVLFQAARLNLPSPRETHWTLAQAEALRNRRTLDDAPSYRLQLLTFINEVPGAGRSTIRENLPGVYKWLWRYDHDWLMTHLPPKKQPRKYVSAKHSWEKSVSQYKCTTPRMSSNNRVWKDDVEVARAVREVSFRLIETADPPKRVTLNRIGIEIPRVRQMSRQAHRAPQTMQAIMEVKETPEDFSISSYSMARQEASRKDYSPH